MKRAVCLLLLASLGGTHAMATDQRVKTLTYEADEIVQIVGRTGIQSTIAFGPEERIENVAVGDSAAWQITPNRRASLLFLKPLLATGRTNMTVVTDRRVYMFDLVTATKAEPPIYVLRFTYPNEAPAVRADAPVNEVKEAAAPAAFSPEQLNFGWHVEGSGRLHPRRIFDDGKALYLEWARDASLPAILSISAERVEGPIDYRVAGDFIVVEPMPSNILLRQGSKTARIWPGRAVRRPVPPLMQPPVMSKPIARPPAPRLASSATAMLPMPNVTALLSNKLAGADDVH